MMPIESSQVPGGATILVNGKVYFSLPCVLMLADVMDESGLAIAGSLIRVTANEIAERTRVEGTPSR